MALFRRRPPPDSEFFRLFAEAGRNSLRATELASQLQACPEPLAGFGGAPFALCHGTEIVQHARQLPAVADVVQQGQAFLTLPPRLRVLPEKARHFGQIVQEPGKAVAVPKPTAHHAGFLPPASGLHDPPWSYATPPRYVSNSAAPNRSPALR